VSSTAYAFSLVRLPRFLLVGGSGVVVNSVALFALYQLVGLPLLVASAIAVELAIASNFIWNDRWTFGRAHLSLRRFARFNVASLAALLITVATTWLLVHWAGVPYLLANIVGIGLASACNFVLSLQWTWRTA
jgi:putative flippase GtrA